MSDRLLPHSPEAEQGMLGCLLLDPKVSAPAITEAFPDLDESCYDLRHQVILRTALCMAEEGEPVDVMTVVIRLKNGKRLEEVGGMDYVASLPDKTHSAANLPYYIGVLRGKMQRRQMLRVFVNSTNRLYEDEDGDTEALFDGIEAEVLRVRQRGTVTTSAPMREIVPVVMQQIEDYHQRAGQLIGISTGIEGLDKMTGGLQNGEMTVLAARPSMGKSALAMNIAEHVGMNLKLPVGVVSLEMTKKALVMRSICTVAGVNSRDITNGSLADGDFPKLTKAAGKLKPAPIHIDDTSGISVMTLRAKARRLVQQFGIKLLVVDYLQLLQAWMNGRRISNRAQEMAEVSAGVKGLAKDLDIPVLVLSQLNRELEKEKDRKPRLSDLRESGSIEQDADGVWFLYHPESDENGPPNVWHLSVNLLIAKQRNGPTGDVFLEFCKPLTKFTERPLISNGDMPQDVSQDSQDEIPFNQIPFPND